MSYSIVRAMIGKLQFLFKKLKATTPLLRVDKEKTTGRLRGINEI